MIKYKYIFTFNRKNNSIFFNLIYEFMDICNTMDNFQDSNKDMANNKI